MHLEVNVVAAIDPYGFDPFPAALLMVFGLLVTLNLIRRYGRNITPRSGKVYDLAINIFVLLMAAATVMAANAIPLIGSLSASIVRHVDAAKDANTIIGSVSLVGGVILMAVLAFVGYTYHKNESDPKIPWSKSRMSLILFAFGCYVLSTFVPWLNGLLSYLVDPVGQSISNGLMGLLKAVLGATIDF